MFSPFSPKELYTLSKNLCEDSEEFCSDSCNLECIHRTAINRSYYASFLHAREWLRKKSIPIVYYKRDSKKRSEHRQVIDYLKKEGKTTVSGKLLALKHYRKKADYDIGPNDSIKDFDAKDSVGLAKEIINSL